jgi:hypothetical protein
VSAESASTAHGRASASDAGRRQPYVSFVAAARNDDHGGDLLARMQVFVDALAAQCARHDLDAELVLVEWNPPPDRPGLIDALRWPDSGGRVTMRIIEVPPSVHARFEHADALPLFQMIAKNVGIRRARAPFVLATNVDLLFSDGVMRTLASRRLRPRTIYRADRYDVEHGIPTGVPVADQLRWCAEHVQRINERRGTRDLSTGAFYPIYPRISNVVPTIRRRLLAAPLVVLLVLMPLALVLVLITLPASSYSIRRGDFVGRARRTTRHVVQLRRLEARRRDRRRAAQASLGRIEQLRQAARELRSELRRARIRPHTNASGDFTLVARDDWGILRGYPELQMYSFHIDGLLLYLGRYAGFREHVLPDPVFHVEHGSGFKPDDEGKRDLFARLAHAGIPWITNEQLDAYVTQMAETRRPLDVNADDWGLCGENLDEREFVL